MNFSFSALVGSIMALLAAIGSWGHHTPNPTPVPTSWNTTSVPLETVYSVSSSSNETAPAYTFKAGGTLPIFTFAKTPSTSGASNNNSSSKNISTINSYLKANDTNTPIPLFNVRPSAGVGSNSSSNADGASPTATEQALHLYGNSVGTIVRTEEATHPNANTDIALFLKAPSEATAIPVMEIGDDLIQAGETLAAMNAVPETALHMHQALATAYQDVGEKLKTVASLRKISDITAAIDTYNQSTQGVGAAFVALVLMFKDQKVQFTPSEAGSVFMFSSSF